MINTKSGTRSCIQKIIQCDTQELFRLHKFYFIHIRTCVTTLRHDRFYEGNYVVMNFMRTVKEYSHIMVVGTLGGAGAYAVMRTVREYSHIMVVGTVGGAGAYNV